MFEDDSDDVSLTGIPQDQAQDTLALRRDKSIRLERDLSMLKYTVYRQSHSNGRRYFRDDGLDISFGNSSIVKTAPGPQSSQRRRRKVGRPQTNRTGGSVLTKTEPCWRLVKPHSRNQHRQQTFTCKISDQNQIAQECKPRIWASTLSELYDIFPGISKANGVSWDKSETPFLVLESSSWPEDNWSDSTNIELSMAQDFSCDMSDLESPLVNISSFDVFRRHYGDTHMNPPEVFHARDGLPFKRASNIVQCTDATSACVLCRDCPFINSVEYHEDLSAMQLSIPNDSNRSGKLPERVAASSKPSLDVSDQKQCQSSASIPRKDCKICEIGLETLSHSMTGTITAAIGTRVPPAPSQSQTVPIIPSKINANDQDEFDDELILLYPPDIDESISSLSRYPLNIEYAISNMRRGLPDTAFSISRHLVNGSQVTHDNSGKQSSLRLFDRRIPTTYPSEIQTLIDAHDSGMPIAIISSRDSPLSPVALPPEFGCCFLGFFFLTDIDAKRIDSPISPPGINGQETGRILWKLRFQWTSGGEDFLPDGENLTTPWWAPASLRPDTLSAVRPAPYMDRKDLLRNCHSLLPQSVLSGPGPHAAGGLFPRGWYCINCGKLNKEVFLRHRKCTSSFCLKLAAEKSHHIGYAERLEHSRDFTQTSTLSFPADLVPETVSSLLSTWTDGMRTYCYSINDHVMVKHVFTANLQRLQKEADGLFRDVQLHVELLRQPKGPGYFLHFVGAGSDKNSAAEAWKTAPSCLGQARDLMIHQSRTYGETEGCSVNQLSTFAWITTGRGKGPVVHARGGVAIVLCLGADAVLSLVPKSGFDSREPRGNTRSTSTKMSVDADEESFTAKGAMKTVSNRSKDVFVITMVHGDVLVFIGDDFEVHIKRTGTTILLIGEK